MTNVGKDVEKLEPLCTLGGNVKWYSYYGKQYGGSRATPPKKKLTKNRVII